MIGQNEQKTEIDHKPSGLQQSSKNKHWAFMKERQCMDCAIRDILCGNDPQMVPSRITSINGAWIGVIINPTTMDM